MDYESAVEIREAITELAHAVVGGLRLEQPTLRDYFAAKAMAGLLGQQAWMLRMRDNHKHDDPSEATASLAYFMADAMIRAREAQ